LKNWCERFGGRSANDPKFGRATIFIQIGKGVVACQRKGQRSRSSRILDQLSARGVSMSACRQMSKENVTWYTRADGGKQAYGTTGVQVRGACAARPDKCGGKAERSKLIYKGKSRYLSNCRCAPNQHVFP
jgi:hypothetical protein